MQNIDDLKTIMATLRGPQGCPWDKVQTPASLTPYAVEEALELEDAIHNKSPQDVKEELGDLLFQVVFHSRMAEEKGDFTLNDVIHELCEKMVSRHPHVFADNKHELTDQGVSQIWETNKNKKTNSMKIFEMPKNFPSLLSAVKIGKKSRTINFDWLKKADVLKHFLSEVKEMKEAILKKKLKDQEEEIGDALFTLAQLARHIGVDPEKALRQANRKIVNRFNQCFQLSGLSWEKFSALSLKEKDNLWNKVKKVQKKKKGSKK